jgi:hypothetical protein
MDETPKYLHHVECDCPRTDGSGGKYLHQMFESDIPDRKTFFEAENKCPNCGAIYRRGDHD